MVSAKKKLFNLADLASLIRYVLYAQIIIAVLAILFGFAEYQLLTAYADGVHASLADAFASNEMAIEILQGIGIVSFIIFVLSAVLILTWIYRANQNAHQFAIQPLLYTPVWSIAYYFIPIFNLWKPYLAMKEIWQVSECYKGMDIVKISFTLPIWWGLWLSSNMLGQSVFRLSASAEKLPELVQLNLLSQIANIIDIPLAIVTLIIVNGISQMQQARN